MWRATVGYDVKETTKTGEGDDWETDPDFVNDVTEEEQRWGSKTVEGSGRTAAAINIHALRSEVAKDDAEIKKKILESGPKASYGYGGRFGLQQDRMDKSAVGHDYIAQVEKHGSQVDAVKGFGGKYGVQSDRQDKSALGWDHHEKVDKHASQKDYASGFGGKFGVQTDRVDKNAVGWDHVEKTEKHESQKDYAKGFGGKFGVDKDRQDKSAVGWEYHEKTEKHPSQRDYAKGFGGKYGVQEDRKDKSALGWDSVTKVEAHPSQTDMKHGFGGKFGVEKDRQDKSAYSFQDADKISSKNTTKAQPAVVAAGNASSLRSRFENMAKSEEEGAKKRAEEERTRRILREQKEKEVAQKDEEERQRRLSLREESGEAEENKEPVSNPVRRTVAVPTPLVQATTAKSASPENIMSFHHGASVLTHPPAQFEDTHIEQKVSSSSQETFLEPVIEEMNDSELFKPPHSYDEPAYETLEDVQEELSEETGLSAVALYDYQAADSDEISFDPDDIITNIEMIDEGWWRGECHGQVGLFPANYVQLLQQ